MPTLQKEKVARKTKVSTKPRRRTFSARFEDMEGRFAELMDSTELALARLKNAGKKGMTLNESRAKRGLPPLPPLAA